MNCKYFGECGACIVYENGYEHQLFLKLEVNKERFSPFFSDEISVFKSLQSNYRSRSEFKIWHIEDELHYAMNHIDKNGVVLIDECPQVSKPIFDLMPKLLMAIKENNIGFKLFGADFLSSNSGEIVVSLLYHKPLDSLWRDIATKIASELGIYIIGRSRKQKVVIGQDYVTEILNINSQIFKFNYIENSFTQPNSIVNEQMIEWSLSGLSGTDKDLLELYCGAGNFTIPFAKKYNKILATEISKSSINAAKVNMCLNDVENVEFVRMGVEEFIQALDGVREFNRMKGIDIKSYTIDTIFVDPPRSGMDETTCNFASRYENIIYISCNPETLARDLTILCKTHVVKEMALFDQFPYTHHAEMGVKLTKKRNHL
ncbi:MAG: tRNA (uridine(54)-C5)-methyltransferase TrmA [Sulfurimonas sp. RIFOXYD12_FULL_33_39]|uniref:tRNA (uridine(54)-C5)-methyltransferase TrmA n=1 Tax=unclassified Sulfurimonas TaxID=2623549 RepID=UPI0008B7FF59|nr:MULTISPECIES: tRNA (uridine(54)-C5)-methyltransferase TrmA [unclassified Sulfurimonas]OHE09502.1 MAG: tRNA (uridine(54)-C5)-methyltransferase TrmA [Sulfurimonas sp. RIFOXYD12_FULL_33_39]OHE12717.1 MAG: tRNA (uridine(54)-C5)-methyltransferase TrmA [Sulfurimonas sp. RIFOXYD2_FULL_34_21]